MSNRVADDLRRILGIDSQSRPLPTAEKLGRIGPGRGVAYIDSPEDGPQASIIENVMASLDGRPDAGYHDAQQWFASINPVTLDVEQEWIAPDISEELYYAQNAFIYDGLPTGLIGHLSSQLISWYPKIQKRLLNSEMGEIILPYRMSHVKPAQTEVVTIYTGIDDGGVTPADSAQSVYVMDRTNLAVKRVIDVFSGNDIAVEVCGITGKCAVAGVDISSSQNQLFLKVFDSNTGNQLHSLTLPDLDSGLVWSMSMTDEYISIMYDDSTAGRRISWLTHALEPVGTMVITDWSSRPTARHAMRGRRLFCSRRLDTTSQISNNMNGAIDVYQLTSNSNSAEFLQTITPFQSRINALNATRCREVYCT